jgi:hypothetical protein
MLYPDPDPDIFTLDSFNFVHKLKGLNQTAVQRMEQSQRIIRALGDFRLNGLNEFHIGLIYLYWGEYHAAEKQFDQARRQWLVVHEPAGLSLTYLGCGYAQELAHHQEAALISYAKAWQGLARLRHLPTGNYGRFYAQIEQCIRTAQEGLRDQMHQPPEPATPATQTPPVTINEEEVTAATPAPTVTAVSSVPMPHSNLQDDPIPVDGHTKQDGRYRWYMVEQRLPDNVIPHIQPKDWLLVLIRPNDSDLALTDEQPTMIVYQSESDSSIHLRPHPSEQVGHGRRICLHEVTRQTGSFTRDQATSEVLFTPAAPGHINLPHFIGIVVGLWRPAERVIGNR